MFGLGGKWGFVWEIHIKKSFYFLFLFGIFVFFCVDFHIFFFRHPQDVFFFWSWWKRIKRKFEKKNSYKRLFVLFVVLVFLSSFFFLFDQSWRGFEERREKSKFGGTLMLFFLFFYVFFLLFVVLCILFMKPLNPAPPPHMFLYVEFIQKI